MHISDVHDYGLNEEHKLATEPFLSQGRHKGIQDEITKIVDDEFERLQDYADEYISNVAACRAETFLERVLKGDVDAARKLFGAGEGRIRMGGCDDGKPWASLIHGRLFETETVRLRRQLVEEHADLLMSERIADLDVTVKGLSEQIRELDQRNRDLEQRLFPV